MSRSIWHRLITQHAKLKLLGYGLTLLVASGCGVKARDARLTLAADPFKLSSAKTSLLQWSFLSASNGSTVTADSVDLTALTSGEESSARLYLNDLTCQPVSFIGENAFVAKTVNFLSVPLGGNGTKAFYYQTRDKAGRLSDCRFSNLSIQREVITPTLTIGEPTPLGIGQGGLSHSPSRT